MLFEALCGRSAFDSRLPEEQTSHLLIYPNLKWEIFQNSLKEFVKIVGQCLHGRLKKLLTMSEIVASLEVALALQENKDSSVLDEDVYDFC